VEGATALMVAGDGMASNWKGRYTLGLMDAFAAGRRERGDALSDTVKLTVLAGEWMREAYHGRYYAKAQNLARTLGAAYDAVLADHDLLLMPTLPMKATLLPDPEAPLPERVARSLEMLPNTAPFDVTGHPAMNVPCGMSDGLPIGMMLVGRPGADAVVLSTADAYERDVFAPPPPPWPVPAPTPAERPASSSAG
jgi:amidase